MRRSKLPYVLVWMLALPMMGAVAIGAQTTEGELRTRLLGKELYLREMWGADRLLFDGAGRLQGTAAPVLLTLAGVRVETLKLRTGELRLRCQRVGLKFKADVPERVALELADKAGSRRPVTMEIVVKGGKGADFGPALDAMFTGDLSVMVPQLPEVWQVYTRKHFTGASVGVAGPLRLDVLEAVRAETGLPVWVAKQTEQPPKVVTPVPLPDYNEEARRMRYSANCVVALVVDAEGKPRAIHVVRPAGLGWMSRR